MPEFDGTTVNVTAIQGLQAVLPCGVVNKADHQIIWMNPKRILISTGDRRVIDDTRMSIERPFVRDWNLHIRNVQTHDDGEYTCQINTNPIQIKRIRLKVHVPAEIDNTSSSTNITTKEGTKVRLTCVARGIPPPNITWYRQTHSTHLARERVGSVGEMLIIHNISRYCGGVYECEASNQIAPPVIRRMKVDVQFSPEVSFRTPTRFGQFRGKEAILECFITAFPQAISEWLKNGVPVAGTKNSYKYRTELYKEKDRPYTVALYLRIANLDDFDFGQYSCEASNSQGRDSETMILVESKNYTPPVTTTPRPTRPPQPTRKDDIDYEPRNGGTPLRNQHTSGIVLVGESYRSSGALLSQTTVLLYLQTTLLFHLALTHLTVRIIYAS